MLSPARGDRHGRETKHVLVFYSSHRLLPANLEAEGGLRETIANLVELSAEFLDYPRFEGESYVHTVTTFLREKYALRPPDVLVVGGEEALAFLLDHRAQLFPTVPVVHMGVARSFLWSIPPLPADVVGVPIEFDLALYVFRTAGRNFPKLEYRVSYSALAM